MDTQVKKRTLPELLVPCQYCEGTGTRYSGEWIEYFEKRAAYENNLSGIMPVQPSEPEERYCEDCEGTGKEPTEDGRAIMELMSWMARDK